MATLLGLVQNTCLELGIPSPTAVTSNSDKSIQQILALLNRFGNDLSRQFEWRELIKEYSLTTTDSTTTQFALPSDWLKEVDQTEWSNTRRRPMYARTTQEWAGIKNTWVYAGMNVNFRFIANKYIEFAASPGNNQTLKLNYVSNSWVTASNATKKTSFTADDDTCIFDDSLIIAGLKLRWRQTKGMDSTYALADYNNILSLCMAQDKPNPVLSMSPVVVPLPYGNIPDGNWHQ